MKTKVLEIILNALSAAEDELFLVCRDFGKMPAKKLSQEYGESGLTHQEYLDIFQLEVDRLKQCIQWLESLQEQPQIEYEKYEFCKSVNCSGLHNNKCCVHGCCHTAKHFHKWLQENNFKIIKENNDEHRTIE